MIRTSWPTWLYSRKDQNDLALDIDVARVYATLTLLSGCLIIVTLNLSNKLICELALFGSLFYIQVEDFVSNSKNQADRVKSG